MKPSFTNQRKVSSTDKKFRPKDEHILEQDKEDVAKINHGDTLAPLVGQQPGDKRPLPEGGEPRTE